jgi:hypothetical protein
VFSCEPGNYVFKVHGVGWYDAYVQVHDREALNTWRSWFDHRHDSGTVVDSSTLIARLRRGSSPGLLGMTIEECDDNDPTNILGSGISRQHLLDRRPSEQTIEGSLTSSMDSAGISAPISTVKPRLPPSFLNTASALEELDDDVTFAFEGYDNEPSHISQHPLDRVAAELRHNARSTPRPRVNDLEESRRRGSECTLDERLYLHADLSQTLHNFKPPS